MTGVTLGQGETTQGSPSLLHGDQECSGWWLLSPPGSLSEQSNGRAAGTKRKLGCVSPLRFGGGLLEGRNLACND